MGEDEAEYVPLAELYAGADDDARVAVIGVGYAAAVGIPAMSAIGELLRQSTEYYSG